MRYSRMNVLDAANAVQNEARRNLENAKSLELHGYSTEAACYEKKAMVMAETLGMILDAVEDRREGWYSARSWCDSVSRLGVDWDGMEWRRPA